MNQQKIFFFSVTIFITSFLSGKSANLSMNSHVIPARLQLPLSLLSLELLWKWPELFFLLLLFFQVENFLFLWVSFKSIEGFKENS